MKDELKTMEAYLKELDALKKHDKVKKLTLEVSRLKTELSMTISEKDKLESQVLDKPLKKLKNRQNLINWL